MKADIFFFTGVLLLIIAIALILIGMIIKTKEPLFIFPVLLLIVLIIYVFWTPFTP